MQDISKRFFKDFDLTKVIGHHQKVIIRGSTATVYRLMWKTEKTNFIIDLLTALLFVDMLCISLVPFDDQVSISLKISIQINICLFIRFAMDIVF